MKKTKVLLLSPFIEDRQTNVLYEELVALNAEPLIIYFKDEEHEKGLILFDKKHKIYKGTDLIGFDVVFIRSVSLNVPYPVHPYTSEIERAKYRVEYLKESSRIDLLHSMLSDLRDSGGLIINDLSTFYYHNTKAQFYQLLESKGVTIPATMASNEKEDILEFIEKYENVVLKSAYGVGATKRVKNLDIDFSKIKTPILFQEEIKGKTIRVHTVGNKVVLALEIYAEDIDSRSDTSGFEIVKLSKKIEDEIIKINELLGIYYSAWDILLTEDGEGYLLDCNPGPYIMWIGNSFARVVMRNLAEFIVNYSKFGSVEEANKRIKVEESVFLKNFKEHESISVKVSELSNSYRKKLRIKY